MEERYLNYVIFFAVVALVMIVAAIGSILIFLKYNKDLKEMQSIVKDNHIYTQSNFNENPKEQVSDKKDMLSQINAEIEDTSALKNEKYTSGQTLDGKRYTVKSNMYTEIN